MELIEGTNLLQYVNQNHGLKINEVQNIFSQLIIAIEYLHNELNISHRDLKLENVMLDFGFSSIKKKHNVYIMRLYPLLRTRSIKMSNIHKRS